jgi:hypothetical protein
MVASQGVPRTGLPGMLAALREGLQTLTITGPFPALEETHRQALEAVEHRPTMEEREAAISGAWRASSLAAQMLHLGNHQAAAQAMEEMYSRIRAAVSASRTG